MKSLLEISKIVTKKRVSKIEIFDENTLKQKKSKFNEFYEALQSGQFLTDQNASSYLYDASPTDDRYRQLKSRFRRRLLDTLFFLDVNRPAASGYDRAYFTSNKDWTLVKILLANDASYTASILAQQILKRALKYKFADVIVNCARILRKYNAEIGDEKKFELYDQYGKQYQDILNAEIRSDEFFQRVTMHYSKPRELIMALQEKIDIYCQGLDSLKDIYDSPVLLYNNYLVWVYRYDMERKFDLVVQNCQEIEAYVEANPIYYQAEKLELVFLKKISAYLHLGNFKEGRNVAEVGLKKIPTGSDGWIKFMEYYLLLAFHTDNENHAMGVFQKVVSHKKFKKQDAITKTKWYIFELYFHYFFYIKTNALAPFLVSTQKPKFKLKRFLSEPALFPLSQRAFSIHVIIIQALFHIEMKKYESASERIDQLRVFANRMKSEEQIRVVAFIRLLKQLNKVGFVPGRLTNSEKYYSKFIDVPFYYRGAITEIEVVPWENLWNVLLQRLS